jgi:hypothetical protein
MSFLSKIGHAVSSVVHFAERAVQPQPAPAQSPAPIGMSDESSFSQARAAPVALTPPSGAVDQGEQRIQTTTTALVAFELGRRRATGGDTSLDAVQQGAANLANQLANDPLGRQKLAQLGNGQLGFDPMHNSAADISVFLKDIGDELRAPESKGIVAPAISAAYDADHVQAQRMIQNLR